MIRSRALPRSCGAVLDRYDLLQRVWGTMAESVHRLGLAWTEAALRVQRHGWQEDSTG